jgi:hypothetical protein
MSESSDDDFTDSGSDGSIEEEVSVKKSEPVKKNGKSAAKPKKKSVADEVDSDSDSDEEPEPVPKRKKLQDYLNEKVISS